MDLAQAADSGKADDLGILPKPLPFGKYYLLEKVNTGGMAEVFKAKAFGVEGFERILALKRILPSIAEDEEFISMFIDEAKIAGQLNHANIAQIFDLGKVSEHYFIALEYIPGRDLRAIFDRAVKLGEKLSIAQVCYITMKLCEGLDYAHNKRDAQGHELCIVHRDISPQNVLISFEGECKLIDFGIAKAHGKSSSTQVGILKGKFSYMSPEQVRGGKIDRRSDIFSLGIVLYELLTLERLFLGSSDFSTLEKIRKVEFSPPTLFNPHIPQEFEDIVLKALARDPADRYQSSHEMQDALQKFMFNQGLYYTNKDLASYMKSAFATEISLEQKKLEYYRTLKKEDLDRANNRNSAAAAAPASGDYGELSWDDDESSTNVFDRQNKTSKEDILAELDDIELPEGGGIAYAKPRANGAADSAPSLEQFRAELPPPRQTSSMAPLGPNGSSHGTLDGIAGLDGGDMIPHHAGMIRPRRSNKGIYLAIGLIVLLSLGAVVAWLLLAKSGPEYGTVRFDIDPNVPVTLEIDGKVLIDPPRPLDTEAAKVEAGKTHEYVIRAEGFGEIRGSFVVDPEQRRTVEVKLAKGSAVAGGTGFNLKVTPEAASVAVDGTPLTGSSPFTRTDLPPGTHTLVISHDGYAPVERTIDVPENTLIDLGTIELKLAQITLTLQSEPDGASYILTDKTTGKELRRGTTGASESIPALPNDHQYEIVVSKNGYESATHAWTPPTDQLVDTELVVLKASRREDSTASTSRPSNTNTARRDDRPRNPEPVREKDPEPKRVDEKKDDSGSGGGVAKAPGVLKINAKPPADIFIDGKSYGKTPKKISLPAGTYNIKLVNASGASETKRVKLDSGQVLPLIHKFVD